MKCVAVGDMFLSEEAFARVLKHHALFCSYQGFSWKADLDRVSTRTLIRKIEMCIRDSVIDGYDGSNQNERQYLLHCTCDCPNPWITEYFLHPRCQLVCKPAHNLIHTRFLL